MVEPRFDDLVARFREHRLDRRAFIARATALGVSASAIGAVLSRGAAFAQGTSGAPQKASEIGVPGITHNTDKSKGTIKLYSSWPMIATATILGGDMKASVQMALDDFGNAAGGFALEYEALDDAIASTGSWDVGKEAENANKVINDKDAMVYIATYNSGAAKISIPLLNKVPPSGMAMISPANTYPGLTKVTPVNDKGEPDIYYPTGKRNYMRVCPTDEIQGGATANWAYNEHKSRKACVLHDNEIYGRGVALAFRDAYEKLGGKVLSFGAFQKDSPDYQSLMTSIAAKNPDLLYVGTVTTNNPAKLIKDMRTIMPPDQVTFVGPDGLANGEFVSGAGDAAEGAYVTFGGLPTSALKDGAGADWRTRLTKKLGHEPDSYAIYCYEAAVVAIQAIDKVGEKDRAKILDTMFKTEGFRGLLGDWSFTDTGDRSTAQVSLNLIKNGQIVFQEPIKPPA